MGSGRSSIYCHPYDLSIPLQSRRTPLSSTSSSLCDLSPPFASSLRYFYRLRRSADPGQLGELIGQFAPQNALHRPLHVVLHAHYFEGSHVFVSFDQDVPGARVAVLGFADGTRVEEVDVPTSRTTAWAYGQRRSSPPPAPQQQPLLSSSRKRPGDPRSSKATSASASRVRG